MWNQDDFDNRPRASSAGNPLTQSPYSASHNLSGSNPDLVGGFPSLNSVESGYITNGSQHSIDRLPKYTTFQEFMQATYPQTITAQVIAQAMSFISTIINSAYMQQNMQTQGLPAELQKTYGDIDGMRTVYVIRLRTKFAEVASNELNSDSPVNASFEELEKTCKSADSCFTQKNCAIFLFLCNLYNFLQEISSLKNKCHVLVERKFLKLQKKARSAYLLQLKENTNADIHASKEAQRLADAHHARMVRYKNSADALSSHILVNTQLEQHFLENTARLDNINNQTTFVNKALKEFYQERNNELEKIDDLDSLLIELANKKELNYLYKQGQLSFTVVQSIPDRIAVLEQNIELIEPEITSIQNSIDTQTQTLQALKTQKGFFSVFNTFKISDIEENISKLKLKLKKHEVNLDVYKQQLNACKCIEQQLDPFILDLQQRLAELQQEKNTFNAEVDNIRNGRADISPSDEKKFDQDYINITNKYRAHLNYANTFQAQANAHNNAPSIAAHQRAKETEANQYTISPTTDIINASLVNGMQKSLSKFYIKLQGFYDQNRPLAILEPTKIAKNTIKKILESANIPTTHSAREARNR